MRYKAIFMDADQTILDFNAAERHAIDRLFARHGVTYPQAYDHYHRVNIACWEAYERGELTLDALKYERFARLSSLFPPETDVARMAEEYEEFLAQQGDLLPHAEETMREIAAALPIVIVTNGTRSVQRTRIAAAPIGAFIRDLLISEEIGVGKPDPRVIALAMERVGLSNPAEALMIGDSLTSDMPAARDAGVDFLWYNPERRPCPPGAHITYEVRDVRDFVPIALQNQEEKNSWKNG